MVHWYNGRNTYQWEWTNHNHSNEVNKSQRQNDECKRSATKNRECITPDAWNSNVKYVKYEDNSLLCWEGLVNGNLGHDNIISWYICLKNKIYQIPSMDELDRRIREMMPGCLVNKWCGSQALEFYSS